MLAKLPAANPKPLKLHSDIRWARVQSEESPHQKRGLRKTPILTSSFDTLAAATTNPN